MDKTLLSEVEAFLTEFSVGETYLGKASCGNSELVARLRAGRPVLVTTDQTVRAYMAKRRMERDAKRQAAE